jgi:hypothetical protein
MNQFDLIGSLRTFAQSKGWVFFCGDKVFQNIEASKHNFQKNQLILGCSPFSAIPNFTNGYKIDTITYKGLILLGRKFESSTESNLDETFEQKHDRRLLELSQMLALNLALFACDNELTLSQPQFDLEINSLDENIDFVVASVTIIQG